MATAAHSLDNNQHVYICLWQHVYINTPFLVIKLAYIKSLRSAPSR
jgi:hypothetical protein